MNKLTIRPSLVSSKNENIQEKIAVVGSEARGSFSVKNYVAFYYFSFLPKLILLSRLCHRQTTDCIVSPAQHKVVTI